jgi:hypothetical protein
LTTEDSVQIGRIMKKLKGLQTLSLGRNSLGRQGAEIIGTSYRYAILVSVCYVF